MTYDWEVNRKHGEETGDLWYMFRGEDHNERIDIKSDHVLDPYKWT
jgi:hypothetical protein